MRTGLIFVGFLACGLTGALAARVLFPPAPAVRGPEPNDERLLGRIRELEERVANLSSVPSPWPRSPVEPAPGAVAAPRAPAAVPDAAPALPDGESGPDPVPEAVIEEKVREVIRERAEAAAAEKARRAAIAQAEKDDAFLRKLQERLDLTDYQREELAVHLAARREAYASYKRKLQEAGPDIAPGLRETLRQELLDFVAVQDEDMRRLLGVDTFDELMRITSGDKSRR